jgi:endonuclease YncB( thermonuclease family)
MSGVALAAHADDALFHCGADTTSEGRVIQVTDGRSFLLDDGREIRLAAIEVPTVADPAGKAAHSALTAMIAGRTLALRPADQVPDRYGRTVAFATTDGEAKAPPIVHAMLAAGHARIGAHIASHACAAELRSHERMARTTKIGLWSSPQYAIMNARDWAGLVAAQGRFSVVEGKVLSVRESGSIIYANFGRRWSQALTVTISKRQERNFAAAGLRPQEFENKRLRVRGWVEVRTGPQIEANRPEQIEFID